VSDINSDDTQQGTNLVMILWLFVIFDTLLKIASRFSSAVVRGTHDLLMAKSARRTIDIRHQPESRSYQRTNSCEIDFAISSS
jgi:hypothetical protein